jgi:hypothetical protein
MKPPIRAIIIASIWLAIAGKAPAQSNWAVAADERGGLYFCDIQRDYVWRYEQGELRLLFSHNHCHTLTLGYDGNLYGEDVGGESREGGVVGVWRLTPEEEKEFLLPLTAKPDPAIWLVRDAVGNSYAWDGHPEVRDVSRIVKTTQQGEVRTLAGGPWGFADGSGPAARFGQVAAMVALPDGTLFVVDEGNLRRVSNDGTVSTVARNIASVIPGGLPGFGGLYNHHMGAAVDTRGGVYVVDYGRRQIVRWDEAGGVRTVFTSGGAANWLSRGSWGLRPTGVAVAGDSIYVMEFWGLPTFAADLIGNPKISRISRDGAQPVVAVASAPARTVFFVLLTAFGTAIYVWRRAAAKRRAKKIPGNVTNKSMAEEPEGRQEAHIAPPPLTYSRRST